MIFRLDKEPFSDKPIHPSLLADPAFSNDPHSHPYYITNGRPTTPPLGHPVLKKSHKNKSTGDLIVNFDSVSPGPPPNSPITPSSSPQRLFRSSATDSLPPDGVISSSLTSLSRPKSTPQPPVAASSKMRRGFDFLTRRKSSQPEQPLQANLKPSKLAKKALLDSSPPSNQNFSAPRPPLPHHVSAPDRRTTERPATPKRPTSSVPPPSRSAVSSRLPVEVTPSRPQDLDQVDVLDETNPWGISLHHGGPYEAAVKAIKGGDNRAPLGRANNGPLYVNHALQANGSAYRPPQAPPGVSLNLSPGQILPRNFHVRYAQGLPMLDQTTFQPSASTRPGHVKVPKPRSSLRTSSPVTAGTYPSDDLTPPPSKPRSKRTLHEAQTVTLQTLQPIDDSSFNIGMAMLAIDAGESSPTFVTSRTVPRIEEEEYNPYNPVHLEEHPRTPSPLTYPVPIVSEEIPEVIPLSQEAAAVKTVQFKDEVEVSNHPEPPPYSVPAPSEGNSGGAPLGLHERPARLTRPSLIRQEDVIIPPQNGVPHDSDQPLNKSYAVMTMVNQVELAASSNAHTQQSNLSQAMSNSQPPEPRSGTSNSRPPTQWIQNGPQTSDQWLGNPNTGSFLQRAQTLQLPEQQRGSPNTAPPVPISQTVQPHEQRSKYQSTGPSMHADYPGRNPATPSINDSERDTRSTHRSISTYASSSLYGNRPPAHRHLPKQLVMPSPLSPAGGQQARLPQISPNTVAFASSTISPPKPQPRRVSQPPSQRYPPLSSSAYISNVRAQDIPVSGSNKLKKRSSVMNDSNAVNFSIPSAPGITSVSFAPPVIGYHPAAPLEKVLARAQTEKIPKRLLSKRKSHV